MSTETQPPAPEPNTYHGGCHCGAFKYSVKSLLANGVTACSCSICSRNAYLWDFPVSGDDFVIEKGKDYLKGYTFAKGSMTHRFCPTCGVAIMGIMTGSGKLGYNVRTLDDIDMETLKINKMDGSIFGSPYTPPKGPGISLEESEKGELGVYDGNCHCGAVRYTVKTEPFPSQVVTCNCSICGLSDYYWIYPPTSAVVFQGAENLTGYKFNHLRTSHEFCSICGSSVYEKFDPPKNYKLGLNVRTLNGVDLDGLTFKKVDGLAK